jgi:hypothetical protein
MNVSVRPQTKLSAVLLAAGVAVAAAQAATLPIHDSQPVVRTIDVRPTSIITDTLYSLSDAVSAAAYLVGDTTQAVGFLPFKTVSATVAAVSDFKAAASVVSNLAHVYVDPEYGGYADRFVKYTLYPLTELLPVGKAEAKTFISRASVGLSDLLSVLPDPTEGSILVSKVESTTAGRLAYAVSDVIPSMVYTVGDVVSWAAKEPAVLEATVESVLRAPSELPGLMSYVVYDAAYAAESVVYGLTSPLTYLPGPIGYTSTDQGLAYKAYLGLSYGLDKVLSYLPTPVTPTALLSPEPAAGKAVPAVSSVPSADAETVTTAAKASDEGTLSPNAFRGRNSLAPVSAPSVDSKADAPDSAKVVKSAPRLSKRAVSGGSGDGAAVGHSTRSHAGKHRG